MPTVLAAGKPIELGPRQVARFTSRIDVETSGRECWPWLGRLDRYGYGSFKVGRRHLLLAHRVAYQLVGPLLMPAQQLDHWCRNRACVRPDHLHVVSSWENTMLGEGPAAVNLLKTQCIHGHELAGANLYLTPDFGRGCRTCRRAADARYKARRLATP